VVEGFHVFSKWRRVGVALETAWDFANVGFVVLVGSTVFEAIAGVAIAFDAAWEVAFVGLFQRMRSNVDFEVFRSGKSFFAAFKRTNMRLFLCVRSTVHQHLVSRIETSVRSLATLPIAVIEIIRANRAVCYTDVICEFIQRLKDSKKRKR
jgi:hypothetical protein